MAQEPKIINVPLRIVAEGHKSQIPPFQIVLASGEILFEVKADGSVKFNKNIGFNGSEPVAKGAALTAVSVAPASLTHTAPAVDDFVFASGINASAWGFSSQNEFHSMLKVLKNAITRISELEDRLKTAGIIA